MQDPATQVFLHVAEVCAAERLDREKRPQYRVHADQGLPHPARLRAGPGKLNSDSNPDSNAHCTLERTGPDGW